jgi:hypothetical protein
MVKFKTPHKHDDMALWDWAAICGRNAPTICENLASGTCPIPCGSENEEGFIPLDLDHNQATVHGGQTNAANCRLICASGSEYANRNRGAAFDDRWQRDFWFDRRHSFDGLRKTQLYAGPQRIQANSGLFILPHSRERLLERCSLLALHTGTGKTMLIVSTLLAINDEVLRSIGKAPRVGSVLYFVSERELAKQLEVELKTEIVKFGLHLEPPTIRKCTEKGDLERGPGHHDFTIACPHALWKRKNQDRSAADIAETLSKYDAIIWDECDFAAGQIDRLVKLAKHALKFGLTATPITGSGDFLRIFAVASVASYRTAFDLDKCLKIVPTWDDGVSAGFIRPMAHSGYDVAIGGIEQRITDARHGDKQSAPGAMAAIRAAIDESHQLELQMQSDMPDHWYSPHIIVRCGNVDEARHLSAQTEQFLHANMYSGHGWRTSIVYAETRDHPFKDRPVWGRLGLDHVLLTPEEKSLSHSSGRLVHPWMRAKELHQGRCLDEGCCRILFVVDMGIRGLNNWTCLYGVDIARGASISVQVQFDGRKHRLPGHLRWILEDEREDLYQYITVRYFFPEASDADATMKHAYDFIHNMDDRFESAGLLSWPDLLEGFSEAKRDLPQDTEQPFSLNDRVQIDTEIGRRLEDGASLDQIDTETVDAIINALPPELTDRRKEIARGHIQRVLTDPEYRSELAELPKDEPIKAVQFEIPKHYTDYTGVELIDFVRSSPQYADERSELISRILDGDADPMIKRLIAKAKHADVQRHYTRPVKILSLQTSNATKANKDKSIVGRIVDPMVREYLNRGIFNDWARAQGTVRKAVCGALVHLFRVDDLSNDGPLDTPGYHHKIISPHVQAKIKDRAVRIMLKNGELGSASALYCRHFHD